MAYAVAKIRIGARAIKKTNTVAQVAEWNEALPPNRGCTRNRVGIMHSESIGISEVGRCICTCNNMMPEA